MRIEIVVWRHYGDWMKVYVDGRLERATHETDFDAEWWVELLERAVAGSATVLLRPAADDEPERT